MEELNVFLIVKRNVHSYNFSENKDFSTQNILGLYFVNSFLSAEIHIMNTLDAKSASLVAKDNKESSCNAGDLGLIPGLGRSPGEENGYPLQDSGLQNSM